MMKWYNNKFLIGILASGSLCGLFGLLWFVMIMTGHNKDDIDGFKDLTIMTGSAFGTLLAVKSMLPKDKDKE